MKTRTLFTSFLCCTLLMASSALYAKTVTQNRSVASFSKIEAGSAFDIQLTQDGRSSVKVEADDSIIDRIKTSVSNGKLVVWLDSPGLKGSNSNGPMVVYISTPTVEEIELSGACRLKCLTPISSSNELELDFSGASSVKGGSFLAKKVSFDLSGASSVKEVSVTADELSIDASGASNCKVNVKVNTLEAEASGASSIKLSGEAKHVAAEASGASSVKGQNFSYKTSQIDSSRASSVKLGL